MNVSLDGFADHTVAVVTDDELHDFFSRLLDSVDMMVFGRVTYELMESAWPHVPENPNSTKALVDFAERINSLPKIVVSRSLEKTSWNNSRIVRELPVNEITALKNKPGKNISVGGLSVCQALSKHGLIDDYWLVVQPVVIRRGKRLFNNLSGHFHLELMEAEKLASGVVALHYSTLKG